MSDEIVIMLEVAASSNAKLNSTRVSFLNVSFSTPIPVAQVFLDIPVPIIKSRKVFRIETG